MHADNNHVLTFVTEEGKKAWEAFAENPERAVVMLDGDGTMWDIVKFPTMPSVDGRYRPVLDRLIAQTGATGMLTGRSVGQVQSLGLLGEGLHVLGQFGCEWYHHGRLTQPVERPATLSVVDAKLSEVLTRAGLADASIEGVKSHFRAVHYDVGTDPEIVAGLVAGLTDLADDTGLVCLPGHNVIELGPKVNKREALAWFVAALPWTPSVVLYAGDSEPDLAAFDVLDSLRTKGVRTLKVGTSDNAAVKARSDLLVHGPLGTLTMLLRLCNITR
ncbi:trehalose-phosphatase [Spirillospora sp. CA-108201]